MNAVDTNVLLYAHDPRDPRKREIATELIASLTDGVLIWQVACEYLAASRKLEGYRYSRTQAFGDVGELRIWWATAVPGWAVFDQAEELRLRLSLSSWDALLVAACLDAGISRLYSEDLQAGLRIGGLEIVNPFA